MAGYELRWFAPGPVALAELEAFAEGPLERRRDEYLLGTGAGLGIKRRGGSQRLECKRRRKSHARTLELDGEARPVAIERWRKTLLASPPHPGPWAAVTKHRARRGIAGCVAELTDLHLALPGQPPSAHASLAIEIGGGAKTAPTWLLAAAQTLFETRPTLLARFARAPSMGYPAWLE